MIEKVQVAKKTFLTKRSLEAHIREQVNAFREEGLKVRPADPLAKQYVSGSVMEGLIAAAMGGAMGAEIGAKIGGLEGAAVGALVGGVIGVIVWFLAGVVTIAISRTWWGGYQVVFARNG